MKIKSIQLEDFTRYQTLAADLPNQVSIIVGHNAAGKTSILDAIAYAVANRCARTDKGGRGAEAMIRSGATEAQVMLSIDGNGSGELRMGRTIPGGLWLEGHDGNATTLQGVLNGFLGVDEHTASLALSSTDFIDLSPADQKRVLLSLLGLQGQTRDDIIKMIAAEIEPDKAPAAIKMLDAAPAACYEGSTGEVFQTLYKHFFELRKNTKRRVKDLGETPKPAVKQDLPDKEEVLTLLRTLRDKVTELNTAVALINNGRQRRQKLVNEIEHVTRLLEGARDTAAAGRELASVEAEISELAGNIRELFGRSDELTAAVEAIDNADKQCPLAPGLVTCTLTKPKRQAIVTDLSEKAAGAKAEAVKLESAMDLLLPRQSELKELAAGPNKTELEGKREALQADLDAEGGTDKDPAELEKELAELHERIEKGENILAEINKQQGVQGALFEQEAERERLSVTVAVLEDLVSVLSPKGLPGRILAETIGPVQAAADAKLRALTGGQYSLEMILEPDFDILISHEGVQTRLKHLSSSERLRVGLVLQDILVGLSGLRLLVIDNADILDPENRGLLFDWLLSARDDFDQVILLSTISQEVVNPHIEGVGMYLLQDGQLLEVE
jgi:DNA repair exonuclease SbcCD ATPase subunit